MSSHDDLAKISGREPVRGSDNEGGSGRSAAALETELKAAQAKIQNHNAERLLLVLAAGIGADVYIFSKITAWAPVLAISILELIVVFVLAYRLGLTEVITFFWAGMRTYGKRDPGDPPA